MSNTLRKSLDMKDKRVQKALKFTFEGRWTHAQIAENCGVSTRTYEYWEAHPDFQAALEDMRKDFAASIRDVTFADKARRIMALDHAAKIALNELEARPLLKEIRPTRDGEIVNEAFNNTAMAEFRSALADIAAEKGERKNVTELSGSLEVKNDATAFERRLIDTLERIRTASPASGTDA